MKRTLFSISAIVSMGAQIILFFGAVTALTLFYLSYRHSDFLTPFTAIGMVLTIPWLIISLLPTVLVLKDRELRTELLWNQVTTMLAAFAILYGLSVFTGFDAVILAQLKAYLQSAAALLSGVIAQSVSLVRLAIDFVATFYRETIAPLF